MTATPVPVRFSDEQIEAIDRLVDEGVGETRSEVIRRAVERLDDDIRRARIGEEMAESYRHQPQEELENWVWTADGKLLPEPLVIEQGIPLGDGPLRPRPGWVDQE